MVPNRDSQLFTQLYSKIYKDLYKYALYVLGNCHDAEDAVSSAVLDAYGAFDRLRDVQSFKGWMFAILCAKCKRTLKTYVNKSVELPGNLETDTNINEEYVDVRNSFARLGDRERQIVALAVLGGYSSAEIGKMLHMNASTVRSVQKRALDKMKKELI